MNEPHENLPDELLEDLLQPLRGVEVPAEAQLANRSAVRQALAAQVKTEWWRRTIPVPVPVAIAASILLLLAAVSVARPSLVRHAIEQPSPPVAALHIETSPRKLEGNAGPDEAIKTTWTIKRSFIRTLTSSAANDIVAPHALENRDDS